jgi:hypothetical protein
VDKQVTKIVLKAEKENSSLHHDNAWPIALHQQSLSCRYWSVIKRGMMNGRQTHRQTTRLYHQMNKENQKYLDDLMGGCSAFPTKQMSTKELERNEKLEGNW